MTRNRHRQVAVALSLAALIALVVPGSSHAAAGPIIRTLAGGLGWGDATNVAQSPVSLAVSGGRLLVVDGPTVAVDLPLLVSNYPGTIWAVDLATGQQTVVAGTGFDGVAADGGLATETTFGSVGAVAAGPGGVFYLNDGGSHRVRRVGSTGG